MKQKPIYYDGSGPLNGNKVMEQSKPINITKEVRKNLCGNPYQPN
ncbi:hypothetical protein [Gracilibacillus sp. YIM 98692]|nr:hypothetical protein [Gracilibacillus sp. YIM 98692]